MTTELVKEAIGKLIQKLDNTNIKQAQVLSHQDQTLGFRFRMPLGAVCSDEYIAEMQKKSKIKTQLELIKECKRIPNISPPPIEFAELFNMCNKLGVVGVVQDKRPEGSHWENLKIQYLKDNPDVVIMEQAMPQ